MELMINKSIIIMEIDSSNFRGSKMVIHNSITSLNKLITMIITKLINNIIHHLKVKDNFNLPLKIKGIKSHNKFITMVLTKIINNIKVKDNINLPL